MRLTFTGTHENHSQEEIDKYTQSEKEMDLQLWISHYPLDWRMSCSERLDREQGLDHSPQRMKKY